jgi:hypothetical protein
VDNAPLHIGKVTAKQNHCKVEATNILHTSEISRQLTTAANHAFAMPQKNIGSSSVVLDKEAERSIQSLFFGEKDVVCHLEKSIGHSVYTADACHMDKNGVGYNRIPLVITRRLCIERVD